MINTNYKVSIITVVYNGAKTIERTIQSVLRQTYKNIEYIVIDGASSDGTQQIIEKYADNISYYISEKDDGIYYAMNKGIERATGEIIGIINSDDWYTDNAVESMVDFFGQKDVGLAYGKIYAVSEIDKVRERKREPIENIWYTMPFAHPSVFVKKEIYDKVGWFNTDYKLASDYELLLRFYVEQVKFGYVDRVIAYFREGGRSALYGKEINKETYDISMSYVDLCPDKIHVLPKIKERYNWLCFRRLMRETKGFLYQLLCEYFNKNITAINIFGTGIWGERCYEKLTDAGVAILHFMDNDASKWNSDFHRIKVIAPDDLQDDDIPVLIAVKNYGGEIKQQLENMGNKKLICVSIAELSMMDFEDINEGNNGDK